MKLIYCHLQVDMHSVHFHGQILTALNHHTDTLSLFPASSITAAMVAQNPGLWLLACNVNDHFLGESVLRDCSVNDK